MKTRKYFFDLDFAKEEAYLRQMNQTGWALTEVKGVSYTFQESPAEDVVYKIDVMPLDKDDWEDYLTIFEEAGWTFVVKRIGRGGHLAYFAKAATDFEEGEEWDIYSDKEAKLMMVKRRLNAWLSVSFFVVLSFPQVLWKLVTNSQKVVEKMTQDIFMAIFTILYLIVISAWFIYMVRLVWQYRKYKREWDRT